MELKYKKGIKTFILPAEEDLVNEFLNYPGLSILEKVCTPCPKEGVILYAFRYEVQEDY